MTASIDRPDWGEGTAIVPAEDSAIAPVESADRFSDTQVEQRYRAMVARRMTGSSLPADDARDALPVALIDEWEASGGFGSRLAQAQMGAIAILERLDPEDREAFTASFDALPEGARSAVFSEISLGSSGSVRNASDADVKRFASTTEGGALVRAWGHRANRNVAVVRDRVGRILGRMEPEDVSAVSIWFDDLSPKSAAAIYRMLVGV